MAEGRSPGGSLAAILSLKHMGLLEGMVQREQAGLAVQLAAERDSHTVQGAGLGAAAAAASRAGSASFEHLKMAAVGTKEGAR